MAPTSFSRYEAYRPGDEIVPGYVLVRRIGGGGFGDVWEAQAPGRIRVALKIIEGLSGAAGGKEFRGLMVVKGVSHPNLCQISAFWLKDEHGRVLTDSECETLLAGASPGAAAPAAASFSRPQQLIIAMQLGDESLFDRLNACQQEEMEGIPVQELLSYLEDASKAIDLLNGKYKIQHCDIKPQNILLLNGAPLVCDFGLARSLDDLRRSTTLTYSPAYGAPELYDGQETPATDQYSLAISYVELRTGRLPFASETPTAVMKAKITGDLDLSRLPEREKSVIERATALEPAERFRSCREMVKALLRAVESVPVAEDEIVPGFKLVREIGAGAYGTVWEGRAPGEIPVAIKILELEESAGRLEFRGLQAIKTINHPNLCPIFGIWLKDEFGRILEQSEGAAFTLETIGDVPPAMISDDHASPGGTDRLGHSDTDAERVPGGSGTPVGGTLQPGSEQITPSSRRESDAERGPESSRRRSNVRLLVAMSLAETSLAQRLQDLQASARPGIPRHELLAYVQDAAKAIDFLNCDHQMRHGDVKPANMLLAGNSVQVCDFGLAQPLGKTRSRVLCTPAYAAPEIHQGASSETSDLYSLAISYYELRTGRLPYRDGTTEGDLASLKERHALELIDVPRRVRAVIHKATAPAPEQRYRTCKEMAKALAEAESRRRTPVIGFLLALILLAAVAAPAVWNLWRRAELLDRWSHMLASKSYADAIALIPSFAGADQEDRWRAIQDAVTEEASAYAKSAAFSERLQGLDAYDSAAAMFAERPDFARQLRENRDVLAKELLDNARAAFGQRAFAEAAAGLTELGHKLAALKDRTGTVLERYSQEAFVWAASAVFFETPQNLQDPAVVRWADVEDRLRSIPRPETMQPGEELWVRYQCLRTQQALSELPSPSVADERVLSLLGELVAAMPPENLLQEYGVADLLVRTRDQVIAADDATVARFANQIDRIWPGLTEIRGQLREASQAMEREDWPTAAALLDKAESVWQAEYAAVPGLELLIVLRKVALAAKRPDVDLSATELTRYLAVVARHGVGNELFESGAQILRSLEARVSGGQPVLDLEKPRQFLDTSEVASRLTAEQCEQLRGMALRLDVLGMLSTTESPDPELVERCEQLRQRSAASAVTDAALVEATLARAADSAASPLNPVQLSALADIADGAYESAAQDAAQTAVVFAGYPAYVRALLLHRRGLPAEGAAQLASLLEEAQRAAASHVGGDPGVVPVVTRSPRVAASLQMLLAATEGLGVLPHDDFLPSELDQEGIARAAGLLRLADAWSKLRSGAGPPVPLDRRLATWHVIAGAMGQAWDSPASEQVEWAKLAETAQSLLESDGGGLTDSALPAGHTLRLVLGLAQTALVRSGAAEAQPETAWQTMAQAWEGLESLRRTRVANIRQQALYDWIIQPAVSIHHPAVDASASADTLSPAARRSLARLYLAQANLLRAPGEVRNQYVPKDEADGPDYAARAAYQQAERLLESDPDAPRSLLAETRVQQFYLRLRIGPDDGRGNIEELGKLVDRALEADPQYPSAIGVRAHWVHENSRSAPTAMDRAHGLAEALSTYDEALRLQEALDGTDDPSDTSQRDRRLLLEGRSAAHLESAFYARDDGERRAQHLAGALHDAAEALIIDDVYAPMPSEAYVKLGNALEDHAYYLQDKPLPEMAELAAVLRDRIGFALEGASLDAPGAWRTLKFAAADATFAKALEYTMTVDLRAFVQLYRGRARYRSALSMHRHDRSAAMQSIREAREDLADAVSEGTLKNPRYRAEAFHWLGELLEFSGDYQEALQSYEAATKLAKEANAPEWPSFQLAWADLLSHVGDNTTESLDQAYRLADEVLQNVSPLSVEGWRTIELLANCKGRRRDRDQVEWIEQYLPATPPTSAEARHAYWRLAHLRSWWAYYRVSDRTKYEAERARAKEVQRALESLGDSTLAGHGAGIYGLWSWKWVRSLGLGARERPQATQETFDALAAAVQLLHAAGEYRVYTADYANALADVYKATALAEPLKTPFREAMQPLRQALASLDAPTRQFFKEALYDELLRQ